MKQKLRQLIAENKTESAVQELLLFTKQLSDPAYHQEAVLQSARLEKYLKEQRQGQLSHEQQGIAIANINDALLRLVKRLPGEQADDKNDFKKFAINRPMWQLLAGFSLLLFLLFWIIKLTGSEDATNETSNSVTVLVHGEDGKGDLVLPNRGMVKLIYGDAIVSKQINNEGEATFKQINDSFFAENANVEIIFHDPQGEPYQAIAKDTLYQLVKNQYIPLKVKLYGLEKIRGIVKDFVTGETIEGARISIRGEEAFSNQYGEFELLIPKEKQQKFQTIRTSKEGYQDSEMTDIPIQTDRETPIVLKPKNE